MWGLPCMPACARHHPPDDPSVRLCKQVAFGAETHLSTWEHAVFRLVLQELFIWACVDIALAINPCAWQGNRPWNDQPLSIGEPSLACQEPPAYDQAGPCRSRGPPDHGNLYSVDALEIDDGHGGRASAPAWPCVGDEHKIAPRHWPGLCAASGLPARARQPSPPSQRRKED